MSSRAGWLSRTPKEWPVPPLYATYEVLLGKMLNQESVQGEHLAPYLRNVDVQWHGINVEDLPTMNFPPSVASRYRLLVGDVLVCEGGEVGRSSIWKGELEECYYQKALHRLRPARHGQLPSYMRYLLEAAAHEGLFDEGATRSTIAHLPAEKLRRIRFPCPPAQTQKAIVTFLDRKTVAIDALIEKKRKLVELLAEKRAALINQAVTKGLDPTVPMKDSGIPWIGNIPTHWEVKRLKRISPAQTVGLVINPSDYIDEEGTVPFIYGSNVSEGMIDVTAARRTSEKFRWTLRKSELRADDLVCVRVGEPGVTAVVPGELDGANCASIMIVRKDASFDSRWLCLAMNSQVGRQNVALVAYGAAQKQYNIQHAVDFVYPTPPLSEQIRISVHLAERLQKHDGVASGVADQITRLQEYRQALITAAVTGQLDIPPAEQP